MRMSDKGMAKETTMVLCVGMLSTTIAVVVRGLGW